MARTVSCNEEIIVVSEGMKDLGKLAMLGCEGKFHPSVIPEMKREVPACKVTRSSAQSIPVNVDTEIIFENVEFDTDDMFDPAYPTKVSIQADGIYQVIAQVYFDTGNACTKCVGISVNDTDNSSGQSITTNGQHNYNINCSGIYKLKKGDYVKLLASQYGSGALNAKLANSLSVFKISD